MQKPMRSAESEVVDPVKQGTRFIIRVQRQVWDPWSQLYPADLSYPVTYSNIMLQMTSHFYHLQVRCCDFQ